MEVDVAAIGGAGGGGGVAVVQVVVVVSAAGRDVCLRGEPNLGLSGVAAVDVAGQLEPGGSRPERQAEVIAVALELSLADQRRGVHGEGERVAGVAVVWGVRP